MKTHRNFREWMLMGLAISAFTSSAACQNPLASADAQVFELIAKDIPTLVRSTPEVNPRGRTGMVAKSNAVERSRILLSHRIKEVTDSDSRGCPGRTSIATVEDYRSKCPATPVSIVIVNDLVNGVQDAMIGLANAAVQVPIQPFSVVVTVYELSSHGADLQSYVYVFKFNGKRAELVKRVPLGMT